MLMTYEHALFQKHKHSWSFVNITPKLKFYYYSFTTTSYLKSMFILNAATVAIVTA